MRELFKAGYANILTRTHKELDLIDQAAVNKFIAHERPQHIFLAAAKVGGIQANLTYRGDFIYQNLVIQTNLIEAARKYGIRRLLFLGSSCIYPRHAEQPIKEEYLLQNYLEPSNEAYAIAKISGIKMCEAYNDQYGTNFVSVLPTNLYGPHDNFDLQNGHVLSSLLRKAHEAKINKSKTLTVWGTGKPKREFLHVNDLATACLFIMQQSGLKQTLNIGSGQEITIKALANLICEIVGFDGNIIFDTSKPDGMPRKKLDSSRINELGWKAAIDLKHGLKQTYEWYLKYGLQS